MEFPMMTTTVMPCSVAVFTIGLLLAFSRRVNLLVILFLCHLSLIHISMGCRTRVFENRFGPKTSIGRGNISFSTINIVRLGIECMNIEDKEQRLSLIHIFRKR